MLRCVYCGATEPPPENHQHQWGPKQLIQESVYWDDDEIYRSDCETCGAYMIITVPLHDPLPENWYYEIHEE